MSVPFLMSQGLLALRRSNPKSYSAPASLRWRVLNADRVFKNSGARLLQESTNSVKTGLLEAYKLKQIWAPFHIDDDFWVPVHLGLPHFQFWDSASKLAGAKAAQQHSGVTFKI